jgi:hypothetical protein
MGGAWRYQARADNREVKCKLNRPSVYAPTHSRRDDVHPASDGQRRTMTVEGTEYTACTGEGGETKTPGSGGCMSRERRDSESATPAAELELQRDRRHLRGPHKEVQ